jgi:hypothetical protein
MLGSPIGGTTGGLMLGGDGIVGSGGRLGGAGKSGRDGMLGSPIGGTTGGLMLGSSGKLHLLI